MEPHLTAPVGAPGADARPGTGLRSLVVTRSAVYPPVGGVALRVGANVEALRRLGTVTVLTLGADARPEAAPDGVDLRPFTRRRGRGPGGPAGEWLRSLHPRRHPTTSALHVPGLVEALRDAASSADLVVLEEVWMAAYLDDLRAAGCRVVYDAHNVESSLRSDMAKRASAVGRRGRERLRARQLLAVESHLVRGADQVWACSEGDRRLLADLRGGSDAVEVVPNTVRTHRPGARTTPDRPERLGPGAAVVYPAMFGYPPNEEAALLLIREVMPRLRSTSPGTRLVLVGRQPTEAMLEAARGLDDVVVTGEVDEVEPWLAHADVVAVPLRSGGGTRLKILEAFAAGVPVVSTGKGAEGLDVTDGRDLLLREDMVSFSDAVAQLLVDPARATALRDAGLALVEEHYSWDAAARAVERHVRDLGLV